MKHYNPSIIAFFTTMTVIIGIGYHPYTIAQVTSSKTTTVHSPMENEAMLRNDFWVKLRASSDYKMREVSDYSSSIKEYSGHVDNNKIRIRNEQFDLIVWIHRDKPIDIRLTPEQAIRQLCCEILTKESDMGNDEIYKQEVDPKDRGMIVLPKIDPASGAIICLRRYAGQSVDILHIIMHNQDAILIIGKPDFVSFFGKQSDLETHRYRGIEGYLNKKSLNVISDKLINDKRLLDIGNAEISLPGFAPITRRLLNACMWEPDMPPKKHSNQDLIENTDWLNQHHCFFFNKKAIVEKTDRLSVLKSKAEDRLQKIGNNVLIEKVLKSGLKPCRGLVSEGGDRLIAECDIDGNKVIVAIGEFDIIFNLFFHDAPSLPTSSVSRPANFENLTQAEKNKFKSQAIAIKSARKQSYAQWFYTFFRKDVDMPWNPKPSVCPGNFWNLNENNTGNGPYGSWPSSVLMLLDSKGKWMLVRVEDQLPAKWDEKTKKAIIWPQDPAYHWFDSPQPATPAGMAAGVKQP